MLPKDKDFKQLKRKMETLEEQNDYLVSVISWMVQRLEGTCYPPASTWA